MHSDIYGYYNGTGEFHGIKMSYGRDDLSQWTYIFCLLTGLALNYILQNNFKASVGMRESSRKIGVLVTDGKSQDDIIVNSQNLRDQGIELYAIGKQLSWMMIKLYLSN